MSMFPYRQDHQARAIGAAPYPPTEDRSSRASAFLPSDDPASSAFKENRLRTFLLTLLQTLSLTSVHEAAAEDVAPVSPDSTAKPLAACTSDKPAHGTDYPPSDRPEFEVSPERLTKPPVACTPDQSAHGSANCPSNGSEFETAPETPAKPAVASTSDKSAHMSANCPSDGPEFEIAPENQAKPPVACTSDKSGHGSGNSPSDELEFKTPPESPAKPAVACTSDKSADGTDNSLSNGAEIEVSPENLAKPPVACTSNKSAHEPGNSPSDGSKIGTISPSAQEPMNSDSQAAQDRPLPAVSVTEKAPGRKENEDISPSAQESVDSDSQDTEDCALPAGSATEKAPGRKELKRKAKRREHKKLARKRKQAQKNAPEAPGECSSGSQVSGDGTSLPPCGSWLLYDWLEGKYASHPDVDQRGWEEWDIRQQSVAQLQGRRNPIDSLDDLNVPYKLYWARRPSTENLDDGILALLADGSSVLLELPENYPEARTLNHFEVYHALSTAGLPYEMDVGRLSRREFIIRMGASILAQAVIGMEIRLPGCLCRLSEYSPPNQVFFTTGVKAVGVAPLVRGLSRIFDGRQPYLCQGVKAGKELDVWIIIFKNMLGITKAIVPVEVLGRDALSQGKKPRCVCIRPVVSSMPCPVCNRKHAPGYCNFTRHVPAADTLSRNPVQWSVIRSFGESGDEATPEEQSGKGEASITVAADDELGA